MSDYERYETDFNFELKYHPDQVPEDDSPHPDTGASLYPDSDFMLTYYTYWFDYCTPGYIWPTRKDMYEEKKSFLFSSNSVRDVNITIDMLYETSVVFEFNIFDKTIPKETYCFYKDEEKYENIEKTMYFDYPSTEVIPSKVDREDYDFYNVDIGRRFGNNDVLLYWHDGKVLNMQYVESIDVEKSKEVTDKSVSIDRFNDSSYSSLGLEEIDIKFKLGDIWYKDRGSNSYRYKNRDSVLRMLYDIYENNIIVSLASDIKIIRYGLISDLSVSQSSDSDNTYIGECTITEVDILDKLPKTIVVETTDGKYEEVPTKDNVPEIPLTKSDYGDDSEFYPWSYAAIDFIKSLREKETYESWYRGLSDLDRLLGEGV